MFFNTPDNVSVITCFQHHNLLLNLLKVISCFYFYDFDSCQLSRLNISSLKNENFFSLKGSVLFVFWFFGNSSHFIYISIRSRTYFLYQFIFVMWICPIAHRHCYILNKNIIFLNLNSKSFSLLRTLHLIRTKENCFAIFFNFGK